MNTKNQRAIKLLFALAILFIFVSPTYAQEGLTEGERIARMEGAYEHLATKADVANLRTELKDDITNLQNELESKISNNGYITWGIVIVASLFGSRARKFLRLGTDAE